MSLLLLAYLIYETKEFFYAGGFANPVACALYRMNISMVVANLIPEDIKPLVKFIKLIISSDSANTPEGEAGNLNFMLSRFTNNTFQSNRRRSLNRQSREHSS